MSAQRRKRASNTPSRIGKSLRAALRAVVMGLLDTGKPAMIIGGIAVIARGVPRLTRDVDATVAGPGTDLLELLAQMARHRIVPRITDALGFAKQSQVLLLRHQPSGVDVDLSLAWTGFELEALGAAERIRLGRMELPMVRVEDLILYKLVAWRPQDQQDVERLLALHGAGIDLKRVRRIAIELGEALEQPSLVEELNRLVLRVKST